MCGIFGFALTKPINMAKAFKVLEKLEVHQYPGEPKPVGGYGAGVAILKDGGGIILEKVGKIGASPARRLSEIVKIKEAHVLIGHVRLPSPQFIDTARFRETAQPYVAKCYGGFTVVSAHNGNVTNYREIRQKLDNAHVFESEKVELIDSEVVPHFFEELLMKEVTVKKALDMFFSVLEGSNAISLMQIGKEGTFLHFVHRGKTRGLIVWKNESGEMIFCSRKEPLMVAFSDILIQGKFEKKVSIPWREDVGLKLSFHVDF